MLLSAELKTAALDYGIRGISPIEMVLVFGMMFAVSMIPYFLLYLSLRPRRTAEGLAAGSIGKMSRWLHPQRHPELLHH